MTNLSTSIAGLDFQLPIMNASGVWCTTLEELTELGKSETGALITKSMTMKARQGNIEPRFFHNAQFSINSMGLPNPGVEYYREIHNKIPSQNKPLIASIAGFQKDEFEILLDSVAELDFNAIEINLSCPNIENEQIFAYDLDLSLDILQHLRGKTKKTLGVKLPAYVSRKDIERMANGLLSIGIDFVSLINSFALGCAINLETESLRTKPNMGIGAFGGSALKSIALAQVILFHHYSKGKLPIIGMGGVETGADVYEFLLAGASAVAVGTALLKEGTPIFTRLRSELAKICEEKKIENLSEKIGALKFL